MSYSNLYISPPKEKRNGTFDYPVLQSIHKTQPCTGRVSFFHFYFQFSPYSLIFSVVHTSNIDYGDG